MNAIKNNVHSISESQAVHKALIELGFVYEGDNRRYYYHDAVGTLHMLFKHSEVSTFAKAACALGGVFFEKDKRDINARQVALSMSQSIISSCSVWEDAFGEELLRSVKV